MELEYFYYTLLGNFLCIYLERVPNHSNDDSEETVFRRVQYVGKSQMSMCSVRIRSGIGKSYHTHTVPTELLLTLIGVPFRAYKLISFWDFNNMFKSVC